MENSNRIILHVDMDYFFAQIEERENPKLKGKPIVVGSDPKEGKGRGVVSTANYEAREYGIRSAMPISRAYRLCPHAIFLPVNFSLYEKVSQKVMKILRKHAVKFEQVGLDEAFLDVTGKIRDFEEARELADKIKQEIYRREKLTCSIGVGPNKLIAKLASDFKKPFGLTVVKPENVKNFLFPLKVRKLLGVGLKTEKKLREMKIKTIGDLAKADPAILVSKFGRWGTKLYQLANGVDESEVEESWEVKSISRENTFEEDTEDADLIRETIDELSKEICKDLFTNNLSCRTIGIKIRYENFETHTHTKTLYFPTHRLKTIQDVAKKLAWGFLREGRKIRLVGVRVSGLVKKLDQISLEEFKK